MSFLIKYGRYSVAKFFNTSEVRRALNNIIGTTSGGGGGSFVTVHPISPLYKTGSYNEPNIGISPSAIITTGAQTFIGTKTFTSTPQTPTPASGFQNANDVVNKNYVDTVAAGLRVVASVIAATPIGFGSGLALYAGDDLDNVTLADQDRVLLKDETNAEYNGIYIIHTSPTAPTRATDYDSDQEVKGGTFTTVLAGTENANTQWVQYIEEPVINVDPLRFSKLGIASSVISVNSQTGAVVLTKADLGLDQVDNTSDLDKPISSVTQTALDDKLQIKDINDAGVGALTSLISPATDLPVDYVLVSSAFGKVWYSSIKTDELNTLAGVNTATTVQNQLDLKAPLSGATLTNAIMSATPAIDDNSTKIATTAYVDRVVTVPRVRQMIGEETITSATFVPVSNMGGTTLLANSTYYFKFKCFVRTNATTTAGALAIGFSVGSATSINYLRSYPTSATAYSYETITAVNTATLSVNGPGATTREEVLEGTIVTGASSIVLELRARTEIATTTHIKVMPGSFGFIQKVV